MREILFRGKTLLGKWVEGDLLQYLGCSKVHIVQNYKGAGGQEVIPETVGQYTGLTDKNGIKIFEGDIVQYDFGAEQIGIQKAIVYYDNNYHSFLINPVDDWMFTVLRECEVIGNIHDNPELLKGGEG